MDGALKTQKFTKLKVSMADGDSVVSWESSDTKIVRVSGKSDITCTLAAQKKMGKATVNTKGRASSKPKRRVPRPSPSMPGRKQRKSK